MDLILCSVLVPRCAFAFVVSHAARRLRGAQSFSPSLSALVCSGSLHCDAHTARDDRSELSSDTVTSALLCCSSRPCASDRSAPPPPPVAMASFLQILGCGSSDSLLPPSLLLFFDQSRYLFGAGEGSQRVATESRVKLSKIKAVFITRIAQEMVGGLTG